MYLTKKERKLLRKALKSLQDSINNNTHIKNQGVCSNLDWAVSLLDSTVDIDTYEVVKYYAKTWKHYIGNANYPVPSDLTTVDRTAEIYYFLSRRGLLWVDDQLMYRQDLIKHMLRNI